MAITKLDISEFLLRTEGILILDVRSPSEYNHAHIPGALSLPLFTDEERKIIGTAYKQESREKAIKIGLESFGKNMLPMVERVEKILNEKKEPNKEIGLHCWRGGMRSSSVAWLLNLYGFNVILLNGGYKAYRNWVLTQFEKEYNLIVLSGYTGSNKTGALHELERAGQVVIDLEGLAGHKGSAFGNLEMIPQPGQEYFENMLAFELNRQDKSDSKLPIWVEAESQRIGMVNIPLPFFKTMRKSTLLFLEVPFEKRLSFIIENYGQHNKEKIISAILRIKKKLGGLEMKSAINFLLEDDINSCFGILLKYYDKLYLKSTNSRDLNQRPIITIPSESTDRKINLNKLLEYVHQR